MNSTFRSTEASVKNHLDLCYQLLDSGNFFPLSNLFPTYVEISPSLHRLLSGSEVDFAALNYAIDRLPPQIFETEKVIFGQEDADFLKAKIYNLDRWATVSAKSRRRQYRFHPGEKTLLVYLASDSDLEDFINTLISLSLEAKKIIDHRLSCPPPLLPYQPHLTKLLEIQLQLLNRTPEKYDQIAKNWVDSVISQSLVFGLTQAPIYLVSSNLHSLVNIIGGYVRQVQDQIFITTVANHPDLSSLWQEVKYGANPIRTNDFLYYASSIYFSENPLETKAKDDYEFSLGIRNVSPKSALPSRVQIIPVSAIANTRQLDAHLSLTNPEKIRQSQAYIINYDYPLGQAAFYLLSELIASLSKTKGIYVIGKAAILSGEVGDIQIPSVVLDEKSGNIFHSGNIFNQEFQYQGIQCQILRDQKAVCVYGTYLENQEQLNNYISNGYNIVEMESGPYLMALLKQIGLDHQSVFDQAVDYSCLPLDFGIINYASDNPLTKNLGEGSMAIRGIEPAYLASLAVVQRIIDLESK
ncbi:MAG: hypothetical protein WCV93_04690 [Candidatus Shapirobacteria bacterium]|jgi:hypothetical protein